MIAKEFNRGYLCVWAFFVQSDLVVFLGKLKPVENAVNLLNFIGFNLF